MKEKETKPTAKTNSGIMKRSNPLSLDKEATITKEVTKPTLTKKQLPDIKDVGKGKAVKTSLTGSKQLTIFIPFFNKQLVKTIKATYPDLSYVQIIEKAWLTLLAQDQPKAYDALLAEIADQSKQ
jgi:hypothetical protein